MQLDNGRLNIWILATVIWYWCKLTLDTCRVASTILSNILRLLLGKMQFLTAFVGQHRIQNPVFKAFCPVYDFLLFPHLILVFSPTTNFFPQQIFLLGPQQNIHPCKNITFEKDLLDLQGSPWEEAVKALPPASRVLQPRTPASSLHNDQERSAELRGSPGGIAENYI